MRHNRTAESDRPGVSGSCHARRAVAKRHTLMTIIRPRAAVPRLILASLLLAVALVRADGPIPLTAVLPGVPALLAVGLGDGEPAVS